MPSLRSSLARSLVVAVVLVTLVGPALLAPTLATSYNPIDTVALERHDGEWLVLEHDTNTTVYRFDDDWSARSTTEIDISGDLGENYSRYPTDLYALPNGSWAIPTRGDDGVVAVYSADWEYHGTLGGPDESESASALPQTDYGGQGTFVGTDAVWTVRGHGGSWGTGGYAKRVPPRPAEADTESDRPPRDEKRFRLGWEASGATDLHRTADGGWLVLTSGGDVVEYTGYWQFTGEQWSVGEAYTFFEIPVSYALIPPTVLAFVALAFGYELDPQNRIGYVLAAVVSFAVALAFVDFSLPAPLSALYLLPDPVIYLLLTTPPAVELRLLYQADRLSAVSAATIALVNLPVSTVSLLFLGVL